jgi:hypothetical protein
MEQFVDGVTFGRKIADHLAGRGFDAELTVVAGALEKRILVAGEHALQEGENFVVFVVGKPFAGAGNRARQRAVGRQIDTGGGILSGDLPPSNSEPELPHRVFKRDRSRYEQNCRDEPQQSSGACRTAAALNQWLKQVHIDPSQLIPDAPQSVNHTDRAFHCPLACRTTNTSFAFGSEFPPEI